VWLMGALVTGAIIWFMYRLNPYNSKVFIMAGVLAILLMFITWVQITGVFWFDVLLKNIVIIAALLFVLLKFKLSEDIESMGRKLLAKLGFGKA
jgi:hypothetical protein